MTTLFEDFDGSDFEVYNPIIGHTPSGEEAGCAGYFVKAVKLL